MNGTAVPASVNCTHDGWPADTDDAAARRDWGWQSTHTLESALESYLIPGVKAHYSHS